MLSDLRGPAADFAVLSLRIAGASLPSPPINFVATIVVRARTDGDGAAAYAPGLCMVAIAEVNYRALDNISSLVDSDPETSTLVEKRQPIAPQSSSTPRSHKLGISPSRIMV